MILLYFLKLSGGRDRRDRLIDNRLVLPKSLAASRADSEMLLKPLLFLFRQLTGGRNGAEL
ncbi:MAG: hypothetical protein WAM69_05505 [Candidatus Sulfotelmatobacter sp.]